MKRFLLKATLFLIPLISFMAILEISIRKIPNEYSFKNDFLKKNSNQLEGIIIGSSHALYGLNPDFLVGHFFNASHSGQTLDYDYALLKKHDRELKKLRYIILTISYFSFFAQLKTGPGAWLVKKYTIYHKINLKNSFEDYFEVGPGTFAYNLKQAFKFYFFGQELINCSSHGWRRVFGQETTDFEVSGKKNAQTQTLGNEHFSENYNILENILTFAGKKKAKVILITPPGHQSYVKNLAQEQLQKTVSTVDKLTSKHRNCYYLNLLTDERFNDKDYYNADHLNESGAKKLSLILANFLKTIEVD